MNNRLVLSAVLAAGLGACATETKVVAVEEDACWTYGFRVGSPEYRLCRDREAAARRTGRVRYGYSEAMIAADAQAACQSYGLTPYTDRYDRCVRYEYAARQPV
jgi:hypothetical protein